MDRVYKVAIDPDLTLPELRIALAPAIADAAAFDGWTPAAAAYAAGAEGVDPAVAAYAFSGGAMAMIAAWIASVDRSMALALPAQRLAGLPIRERIRTLVRFRLDSIAAQREALRRALSVMALPPNVPAALRLGWRSADAMWRLAGDTATDYNHYTKRATLSALYASTLAVFAYDASDGQSSTDAFLDRRIEDVMRFEKAKHQLLGTGAERFSMMRFLGRLRYPAR